MPEAPVDVLLKNVIDPPGYDPINDATKTFTLPEFVLLTVGMLYEYWSAFYKQNEFYRGSHNYKEWMDSFMRWKSK